MNTTENNKIIAEFMKIIFDDDKNQYYDSKEGLFIGLNLKYHSDWNWLMEVVEKIEDFGFIVQIYIHSCFIKEQEHFINNKAIWRGKNHGKNKIQAVYNACLEFIKWYNEQR